LDGDRAVDLIGVHEYQEARFRGYSLIVHMPDQSAQEVADVRIREDALGFDIEIQGNSQIYGHNHRIIRSRVARNVMVPFLVWAFIPRPVVYVTPVYHRGHYPSWYVAPAVVPVTQYRTGIKPVIRQDVVEEVKKPLITTTVKSPNEGKSSSVVVAPLANPTSTQKQFQERPETKQIQQASGFAKPKPADAGKPAVQKALPTGTVQTPAPATGVAPVTSSRTTTDKPLQERAPGKEISPATGFGKKSAPSDAQLAVPAPTHQAAPAPALAPVPAPVQRITPQAPGRFIPRVSTSQPPPAPAPAASPVAKPAEKAKATK
jgi:hypothetical protein